MKHFSGSWSIRRKKHRHDEINVGQREFDLVELTRRLEYPKPTVHRMLLTLKLLGYVKQSATSAKYSAALKLFQLGHSVLEHNDLFTVGQPRIEELSRETGESVYIIVLDGLDVVVSAKAKRSYGLRWTIRSVFAIVPTAVAGRSWHTCLMKSDGACSIDTV